MIDRRQTCVLVTGFGSFPGAPVNPTLALVDRLARSRRAALAGARVAAHVFATRYEAVDEGLPALLTRERPDALIMFGVAIRAKQIRVELVARNRKSILFPDAAGATAGDFAIARGGPSAQRGRFSLPSALAAVRRAGLGAIVSRDAGRYLCNYAYWRALERAAQPDGPRIVLFVHVPPVRTAPRPRQATPRLHTPADLARAGEALLLAAVAMARSQAALPARPAPPFSGV
ncbi:MAG: pyroglutamyl-peptidase I [Xanthobacteraceae bacterium]